jgi:MFS family permease
MNINMSKLLRNRNVLIIWISRAFSRFGDALENLALMYAVYDLTGSGLAMGTVMLFSMIPNIIVSPIAGVIVDRYNKKTIMIISEITRSVFILLIPLLMFTGHLQLWHIYGISVIVSIAESFFEPCSGVVFTLIVSKEELPLINSLSTTTNSIMRVVGYSVAGVIITLINKEILFIIDALTFFISAIAATMYVLPKIESRESEKSSGIMDEFVQGVKYTLSNDLIPILFLAILVVTALTTPIVQFIPILTEKTLKLNPIWAGYFLTLNSIGNIFGGIIYPVLLKANLKLKEMYLISLCTIGISMVVICYYPNKYIALIMFFIVGSLCSLIGMWSFTEIQKVCKTEYFGRVCSLTNIVMLSTIPFASAINGWLIDIVLLSSVIKVSGVLFIVFGVILFLLTNSKAKNYNLRDQISEIESLREPTN